MNDKLSIRPAAGSHLEAATTLVAQHNANKAADEVAAAPLPKITKPAFEGPRSNVVAGDAHAVAIRSALNTIARIVGRTLGPHGSNTLVRSESGSHFATKDGYTVLQRTTFVQEIATMVLDHVRSVSRTMVRKVGDGSTSAVVMADSLYDTIIDTSVLRDFPPGAVQAVLSAIADVLVEKIRERGTSAICAADLLTVATISANNDPAIGALIANAYEAGGEEANVFAEIGTGDRTVVRKEPGYRVMRGMVHEAFANEVSAEGSRATRCRLHDVRVLIYDGTVDQSTFNTQIAPVMNGCIELGVAFALVARDYGDDVVKIVAEFMRKSPGIKLVMLDHAGATRRGMARMGDLAAVLGTTVVMPGTKIDEDRLGFAAEVRSGPSDTVFVLAGQGTDVAERVAQLREQADRMDMNNHDETQADEIAELRARIRAMLGSEVTISVGGATEQEKQALHYLIEDSILAVRAANRSGVVEGLGMTAQRVLADSSSDVAVESLKIAATRTSLGMGRLSGLVAHMMVAVQAAYLAASSKVLENAHLDAGEIIGTCLRDGKCFDVMTGEYTVGATVLAPTDTDVEVLRGAMSIVSLLVSSNQTVLIRPSAGLGLD
jgi:chaperonin GroEL